MGLSFAFPAAFWGLLGLPLVVALHFLQSRNRREQVSSLFLLELLPEETRSGAVFTYLRNGLQLWMQLLAVLLLSLLLARPMLLREESIQSVAVVVDSSLSMQAFDAELQAELARMVELLERSAGKTEWWLEPSDTAAPSGVRAVDAESFLAGIPRIEHFSGPHSPRAALLRARQLVGPEGLVIFVSDHVVENLPAGAVAVSVGHPVENTGLVGIEIENGRWSASLLKQGGTPALHSVELWFDGKPTGNMEVNLQPGAVGKISGSLPGEFTRGELRLADDVYPVDNVMPFVPPQIKPLSYAVELKKPEQQAWADKLMSTLEGAQKGGKVTLSWKEGWPITPEPEVPAEIWWLNGDATSAYAVPVPGADSLAEGLGWEGFLGLPYSGFQVEPSDTVELWMGEQPLVVRRETTEGTRLLMNFELAASNAMRFPSMLLLLHRFLKAEQAELPLPYSQQLEARQVLPPGLTLSADAEGFFQPLSGEEEPFPLLRYAPERPGFLRVMAGEERVFRAGVSIGDVAEGNFIKARPQPFPNVVALNQRTKNSQTDLLMPLWFALLAGALTLGWWSERNGAQS